MTSIWVRIGMAVMLACAAGGGWGGERTDPDNAARYGHTRCVVLARLGGQEQLAVLADEIEQLRRLGAPEIVVVIAGISVWPDLDDTARQAAQRLRRNADRVLPEWRATRKQPRWLDALGPAVPSALLETAYWQDRGYRLLPYEPRNRPAAQPRTQDPASADPASTSKPRLRFSW